jgi:hypothetical protein
MSYSCPFVDKCEFLFSDLGLEETMRKDYFRQYCEDEKRSMLCLRRVYMEKLKQRPPVNMDPRGTLKPKIKMA